MTTRPIFFSFGPNISFRMSDVQLVSIVEKEDSSGKPEGFALLVYLLGRERPLEVDGTKTGGAGGGKAELERLRDSLLTACTVDAAQVLTVENRPPTGFPFPQGTVQ